MNDIGRLEATPSEAPRGWCRACHPSFSSAVEMLTREHLARVEHWLSRRRPRVRAPSTPPTILHNLKSFRLFVAIGLQTWPEVAGMPICKTGEIRARKAAISGRRVLPKS
jgi:hypothetical protein